MISLTEAKAIIQKSILTISPAQLLLQEAVGLTLAADVYATIDIPAFPQSSMDGYAFSFNGWSMYKSLIIEGEMAAGDHQVLNVSPQKAVRIFTGAAVPPGADTVVMQEKIRFEEGKLVIEDEKIQKGSNVRIQGSEVKAGTLALPKGSHLSPAAIGFLAGIGVTEVPVYPYPSISIIVTGNELQQPGNQLQYGQVFESNSFSLTTALQLFQIRNVNIHRVPDDLNCLTDTLQQALQSCDIVLITGGISVGDYDFVLQAASRCGIAPFFHKVKQRPGKPLFFGMKENKPVFGLPGNPSSVLTCFYMYVVPAMEQFSRRSFGLRTIQAPLSKPVKKAVGLTHFLKGYYNGQTVTPLDAQESYRMHSFARANCLVQIEEATTECIEGTLVDIHLLPM